MAQSRKRRRKKRSRQRGAPGERRGSMMSMRQGIRNITGRSESRRPQRGSSFLTWLIVLVMLIIVVMWLSR